MIILDLKETNLMEWLEKHKGLNDLFARTFKFLKEEDCEKVGMMEGDFYVYKPESINPMNNATCHEVGYSWEEYQEFEDQFLALFNTSREEMKDNKKRRLALNFEGSFMRLNISDNTWLFGKFPIPESYYSM